MLKLSLMRTMTMTIFNAVYPSLQLAFPVASGAVRSCGEGSKETAQLEARKYLRRI